MQQRQVIHLTQAFPSLLPHNLLNIDTQLLSLNLHCQHPSLIHQCSSGRQSPPGRKKKKEEKKKSNAHDLVWTLQIIQFDHEGHNDDCNQNQDLLPAPALDDVIIRREREKRIREIIREIRRELGKIVTNRRGDPGQDGSGGFGLPCRRRGVMVFVPCPVVFIVEAVQHRRLPLSKGHHL